MPAEHILIVDDDPEICGLLSKFLKRHDYRVTGAQSGTAMFQALAASTVDLVILDLMLPGEDGLTLCRRLRQESDVPLIMLTAMRADTDRIVGLEIGADDYIPKPFEPRELLTRIQTILRRARAPATVPQSRLVFDGLEIDLERRQVLRQGEPVELTGTEFELLAMLAGAPRKVFHRDEILNRLRGQDADLYTRAVDILVSRLRKKLEPLDCIKTLRNAGYAFAGGHI